MFAAAMRVNVSKNQAGEIHRLHSDNVLHLNLQTKQIHKTIQNRQYKNVALAAKLIFKQSNFINKCKFEMARRATR